MITYVDTNVLVALVDAKDRLRPHVRRDLAKLKRTPLVATWSVLTETFFLLQRAFERHRLRFLLDALNVGMAAPGPVSPVLDWLEKYEEHMPDFADAELVIATQEPGRRLWTYDSEFWTVWRRSDGSKVPLANPVPRRR